MSESDYYTTGVVVWGDAEQLATVRAKPTAWFPSWAPPGQTYEPTGVVGDGYVFFETQGHSALPDWIERHRRKPRYDRLYWLLRWRCPAVGAGAYALRGTASDSWVAGLERLTPLQHKLELLHLLLRTVNGSTQVAALDGAQDTLRGLLVARPEWGEDADEGLARGCDLQAAV